MYSNKTKQFSLLLNAVPNDDSRLRHQFSTCIEDQQANFLFQIVLNTKSKSFKRQKKVKNLFFFVPLKFIPATLSAKVLQPVIINIQKVHENAVADNFLQDNFLFMENFCKLINSLRVEGAAAVEATVSRQDVNKSRSNYIHFSLPRSTSAYFS